MTYMVLAREGKMTPYPGQGGRTVRDKFGTLRITAEGLFSPGRGKLIQEGPVAVPDSLLVRRLIADGDLLVVETKE